MSYSDHRKPSVEEVDLQKEAVGEIHGIEANPAAAALAAITEAQKPRMFSKGMIRLWLIVNHPARKHPRPPHSLVHRSRLAILSRQ